MAFRCLRVPLLFSSIIALTTWSGSAQVRQVNIPTDATDTANSGDTEPSIAVNPTNPQDIAVVAFSDNWSAGSSAAVWRSSDGGLTWRRVPQIPQPQAGSAGPGDQKIAFDSSGRLHIAELGLTGPTDFVMRQTGTVDAGLTVGAGFGDDQPHLDIDRTSGGCANRLYSPWLNTQIANNRSNVVNSTDRGANVTNVAAGDNSSFANRTTRIAIAPNGRAYIIYKTREGSGTAEPNATELAHFHVNRSDDCGATWTGLGVSGVSVHGAGTVRTFFTNQFGNPAKGPVARARSSDAWIAASPNGDIYAAFVSRDASGFGQIFVARSTNQGSSWTRHRVTDGTHHSAYPEIAVAQNGAVGVLFIDFDDSGTRTQFRHHFARSFDDGTTWTDQMLQSMDPTGLAGAASGFLWGDYEGLTAQGNTFFGVYTGQATGRTTAQFDPIFFRDTAFQNPPRIQVPSPVNFPPACVGSPVIETMNVCNTGGSPLTIFSISSSSPQFSVIAPSGGFPVTVAPGACFPFQVRFTPSAPGAATATLTIASDDPANLSVPVLSNATVGSAISTLVMTDTGNFGTVCRFRDLPLTIQNSGSCTLVISNLTSSSADFQTAQVLAFPISVAPGTGISIPIRFQPTSAGPKAGTLTVTSNDPASPKTVAVSGTGGQPTIVTVVADNGDFGSVCTRRFRDLAITVNNSGTCPLKISAITSSSPEFQTAQTQVFPIVVAPGASIAIPIRYQPTSPGLKTATITLQSDDPVTPNKTVTMTATTPPNFICHPSTFASLGFDIGPTFGVSRPGDYSFGGKGRFLTPFGARKNFGVQLEGEYIYFPRLREGQFDAGLLWRRHIVQLGLFGDFKHAGVVSFGNGGGLGQATFAADFLLPHVRFGIFGTKGFLDNPVVNRVETITTPPPGGSVPIMADEVLLKIVDQFGGNVQFGILPRTYVDASLAYLKRHAPGASDKAGATVRLTHFVAREIALTVAVDLNPTYVEQHSYGRVVFGVQLGGWSRPRDYSNHGNPLGVEIPRIHYEFLRRRR